MYQKNLPLDYAFQSGIRRPELKRRLAERLNLRAEARRQGMDLLDTFDWRLHRAGWTLEVSRKPQLAILRGIADGRVVEQTVAAEPHGPMRSWPDGAVKATVADAVGIRALLPLAQLAGSADSFAVLNTDAKTVARLSLEEWKLAASGNRAAATFRRLRITPLRGWSREARLLSAVVADIGLTPAPPLRDAVLEAIGRKAGDYSSRFGVALDPGAGPAVASYRVFDRLYRDMLRNEDGMRRDLDPEFRHDFRVAVRRTRSAMWAFGDLFGGDALQPFKERFRDLGRVTGHKRNLDVHLEDFDHHLEPLPVDTRQRLLPLRKLLEVEHREAGRELNAFLRSAGYRGLKRDWSRFLEQAVTPGTEPGENVTVFASRAIHKTWRRLVRDGRAIGAGSPDEQLHDLRKTGKRLRYLLEFFRTLYPAREIGSAIGELKRFQDLLGSFQDHCVQIDTLESLACRGAGDAREDVARLVHGIKQRRDRDRREFDRSFRRFDGKANHARYRKLFAKGGPKT